MDIPGRHHRSGVEKRLRYLRNWELANVLLLPGMVVLMWRTDGDLADAWARRWVGVGAVSYVLLQGGVYWHLKLEALRGGRRALPAWFPLVFVAFRRTNPIALAVTAIWMVASPASPGSGLLSDLGWGLALVAFAALEHVNYYVRQLMHDTERDVAYLRRYRRLRRSPLRRDLDVTAE